MLDEKKIYSSLDQTIAGFNLSIRAEGCLKQVNITKIRDLILYTEKDLLKIKNFGRKSLREITDLLSSLGLRLGMSDADINFYKAQQGGTVTELLADANSKNNINTLFKAAPWMIPVVARFLMRIFADAKATVEDALNVKRLKGSEIKISDALSSIGFQFFGTIYDEIYDALPEQMQIIVKKRTHAYPSLSLDELGTEFGLTRERVRQIEIKVRDKIRKPVQTD